MEAKILIVNTSVAHVDMYYLYELSLLNKHILPITLHCDTQVAIYKAYSKNFIENKNIRE